MTYTNLSGTKKTVYGVTFQPGDTKSVPGYINLVGFVVSEDNKVDDKHDTITAEVEPIITESDTKQKRKSKKEEREGEV